MLYSADQYQYLTQDVLITTSGVRQECKLSGLYIMQVDKSGFSGLTGYLLLTIIHRGFLLQLMANIADQPSIHCQTPSFV